MLLVLVAPESSPLPASPSRSSRSVESTALLTAETYMSDKTYTQTSYFRKLKHEDPEKIKQLAREGCAAMKRTGKDHKLTREDRVKGGKAAMKKLRASGKSHTLTTEERRRGGEKGGMVTAERRRLKDVQRTIQTVEELARVGLITIQPLKKEVG